MSQTSFDAVWGVLAQWSCCIGGAWVLQEALNIQISKDCRTKFCTDLCNSQWPHQPFLVCLQFSLMLSLGYSPVGAAAADSKDTWEVSW